MEGKAKFIRKYYGKGFERDFVFLVYGYRGHEYTVYENRANGNEPLAWQHRSEQAKIDRLIEEWNKPKKPYRYEDSAQYGVDLLLEALATGDDSIFDKTNGEGETKMKKNFNTLRELVDWLESNQGKNIEVCGHADDAGWQSAEDALASYREILDHASEAEEACFSDTELEIREVAR